jgi:hypothetical protein
VLDLVADGEREDLIDTVPDALTEGLREGLGDRDVVADVEKVVDSLEENDIVRSPVIDRVAATENDIVAGTEDDTEADGVCEDDIETGVSDDSVLTEGEAELEGEKVSVAEVDGVNVSWDDCVDDAEKVFETDEVGDSVEVFDPTALRVVVADCLFETVDVTETVLVALGTTDALVATEKDADDETDGE